MSYSLFTKSTTIEIESETDLPLPPKREIEQKCRAFDLTVPAFDEKSFGLESLGVRPEVVPLIAFQKGNMPQNSRLLDITINPESAKRTSMGFFYYNQGNTDGREEHVTSEMIGEGLSVIYYPVWAYSIARDSMESTLFIDGLAKRVINEIAEAFENSPKGKDESTATELNPVQHKCPNCGFDLPISDSSLFYHCSNCDHSYLIKDDGYQSAETLSSVNEQGSSYYPFWRFPFSTGAKIKTVAEFSKILPGEIPLIAKNKAQNIFYLYSPAFKIADLRSLTARGIRLCNMQPILEIEKAPVVPAAEMVLPESEGKELVRFYWNSMRIKYKFLDNDIYNFDKSLVGAGELIWLTMDSITSNVTPLNRAQTGLHA